MLTRFICLVRGHQYIHHLGRHGELSRKSCWRCGQEAPRAR